MHVWALLLVIFTAAVFAQEVTRTVTVPGGQTVVIDIIPTQDENGAAITTTTTLRTLGAVQTHDQVVGVAPSNPPGSAGPIIYYVTTYDEEGNTIIETHTFTPSFAASSALQTYPSGTIYDYESWASQFATRTSYPNIA
ncbi:hypothetical protein FRC15_006505, partial [Serendipita sp. 397]